MTWVLVGIALVLVGAVVWMSGALRKGIVETTQTELAKAVDAVKAKTDKAARDAATETHDNAAKVPAMTDVQLEREINR